MNREWLKVCAATLALLLTTLTTQSRAAAPTQKQDELTAEESREARELALDFMTRLLTTRDLGAVVRELYVADFMPRQLEELKKSSGGTAPDDFMLDGVPALTFKRALLAHPASEYWPRLHVAAHTLIHFGMISSFADGGPPDVTEKGVRALYPPEAVRLLDANPTLANFLFRRGAHVAVSTPGELRAVTETLEEAVRLTRAQLDKRNPLKPAGLESVLAELRREPRSIPAEPFPAEAGFMGFPAGTRFVSVLTPVGLSLVAARHDGQLRIVAAHISSK